MSDQGQPMSEHPAEEKLLRFAEGRVTQEEAREIVRHLLAGCGPCRGRVNSGEAFRQGSRILTPRVKSWSRTELPLGRLGRVWDRLPFVEDISGFVDPGWQIDVELRVACLGQAARMPSCW